MINLLKELAALIPEVPVTVIESCLSESNVGNSFDLYCQGALIAEVCTINHSVAWSDLINNAGELRSNLKNHDVRVNGKVAVNFGLRADRNIDLLKY
jgi:hypothetical protein